MKGGGQEGRWRQSLVWSRLRAAVCSLKVPILMALEEMMWAPPSAHGWQAIREGGAAIFQLASSFSSSI